MNTLINLTNAGLIGITGSDSKSFLQGQLTCHLEEVSATQSTLAARCNLQGRVRALFRLSLLPHPESPQYIIRLPSSMVDSLTKDLKQYAIFSKVEINNLSPSFSSLGLVGEKVPLLLQDIFQKTIRLDVNQCENVDFNKATLQICRLAGETARFEIIGPTSAIDDLKNKIMPTCVEASPNLWDECDIQAGIPAIYPETQDQFLPHHLNLVALGAIHFKKGCYLGQEIIARMHYKGKIKKGLYRLHCETSDKLPKPGDPILEASSSENDSFGNVVSICQTETGCELLAILDNQLSHEDLMLSTPKGPRLSVKDLN